MIKKWLRSLNGKLTGIILLAFALAVLMHFGANAVGQRLVTKVYMSPEAVEIRKDKIFAEFAEFVRSGNISSRDTAAVSTWSNRHKYAGILIYNGTNLNMYVREGTAGHGDNYPSAPEAAVYQPGSLYTLRFSDAICRIAVSDTSEARYYAMANIAAFAAAALLFFLVLLSYFSRQTKRIIALSREASEISAGDMEHGITISGGDEIAALARDMDKMRRSVIERMGTETRALQANQDLITAISHDIRTPMTALLGYLGLINDGGLEDSEQLRTFAASAYAKAIELRELTDELFKYFLVFGKSEYEMNAESIEAALLSDQLISEAEFDLLESGFASKRIGSAPSGFVKVDPLYLKRVMDNIVSNIKKYADPNYLVVFLCEQNEGSLSLCVSNNIKRALPEVESTKIGLRTCEKIMEHLGGKFISTADDAHFMAEFVLPIKPTQE